MAELLAAGLRPEDFGDESCEVWPENERVIELLVILSTQWRVGFSGPTGLDYTPMFHLMGRMGLSNAEYDHLLNDMRHAEAEALSVINNRD